MHLIVGSGAGTATWEVPFVIIIGMLAGAGDGWRHRVDPRASRLIARCENAVLPKLAFLISAIGASFFLSTFASKLFNNQTANPFPAFFNKNYHLFVIDGAPVTLIQVIIVGTAGRHDDRVGPIGDRHQAGVAASGLSLKTHRPLR